MPRMGLNRDAVITAAVALGDDQGFAAVTINNLARTLGIKPPSLYKHVEGLDDLMDTIGIRAAENLTAKLQLADQESDPSKKIAAACVIYRQFALDHPTYYQSLQPAMARRSAAFQQAAGRLLETIYLLVTALGVPKKNLVHAVRTLRSMLHGFVELERSGGFGMPVDTEESFQHLVRSYTLAHQRR